MAFNATTASRLRLFHFDGMLDSGIEVLDANNDNDGFLSYNGYELLPDPLPDGEIKDAYDAYVAGTLTITYMDEGNEYYETPTLFDGALSPLYLNPVGKPWLYQNNPFLRRRNANYHYVPASGGATGSSGGGGVDHRVIHTLWLTGTSLPASTVLGTVGINNLNELLNVPDIASRSPVTAPTGENVYAFRGEGIFNGSSYTLGEWVGHDATGTRVEFSADAGDPVSNTYNPLIHQYYRLFSATGDPVGDWVSLRGVPFAWIDVFKEEAFYTTDENDNILISSNIPATPVSSLTEVVVKVSQFSDANHTDLRWSATSGRVPLNVGAVDVQTTEVATIVSNHSAKVSLRVAATKYGDVKIARARTSTFPAPAAPEDEIHFRIGFVRRLTTQGKVDFIVAGAPSSRGQRYRISMRIR